MRGPAEFYGLNLETYVKATSAAVAVKARQAPHTPANPYFGVVVENGKKVSTGPIKNYFYVGQHDGNEAHILNLNGKLLWGYQEGGHVFPEDKGTISDDYDIRLYYFNRPYLFKPLDSQFPSIAFIPNEFIRQSLSFTSMEQLNAAKAEVLAKLVQWRTDERARLLATVKEWGNQPWYAQGHLSVLPMAIETDAADRVGTEHFLEKKHGSPTDNFNFLKIKRMRVSIQTLGERHPNEVRTRESLAIAAVDAKYGQERLEILAEFNEWIDRLQTDAISALMRHHPDVRWNFGALDYSSLTVALAPVIDAYDPNKAYQSIPQLNAFNYDSFEFTEALPSEKVGLDLLKLGFSEKGGAFIGDLNGLMNSFNIPGAPDNSVLEVIKSRFAVFAMDSLIIRLSLRAVTDDVARAFTAWAKASDLYTGLVADGDRGFGSNAFEDKLLANLKSHSQYHRGTYVVCEYTQVARVQKMIAGSITMGDVIGSGAAVEQNRGGSAPSDALAMAQYEQFLLTLSKGKTVVGYPTDLAVGTFIVGAKLYGFNVVLWAGSDDQQLIADANSGLAHLRLKGHEKTKKFLRGSDGDAIRDMMVNRGRGIRDQFGDKWQGMTLKRALDFSFWDTNRRVG